MPLISIREHPGGPAGANATVSFEPQDAYPITVTDPFTPEDEARVEWYFEQHVRFPFVRQVEARDAAASVATYGERLFQQVFLANPQVYARYLMARQAGLETLRLEIAGTPEFQRLHWEALQDPDLPQALALLAPMVRTTLTPQTMPALWRPAPVVHLLLVTARPQVEHDVGYRTISRPLVDILRQAEVRVQMDHVRPGTYRALVQHLDNIRDRHGAGYYHIIHFDVHGALLTYEALQRGLASERYLYQARYGRADLASYDGQRAFIFLEGDQEAQADPVQAEELAQRLMTHQIPCVILNACQSGKQIGASETSLGSRLLQAGVQTVLAMGYTVTVSAAELLMRSLYTQLCAGRDFSSALRRARLALHDTKGRRAYFDQTVDLEDWLLPVAYQHQELRLSVRDFADEAEASAYYERQAARYPFPQPPYGFVGRDLDILRLEKRLLLRRNLVLVRGMGGAGKTTLLHHLGAWWQTTGLVEQVWYFGYDAQAWTRQQLMVAMAQRLLTPVEYARSFQPLSPAAQQARLAELLRAQRHLLILDNLESITGSSLAIPNTLPPAEQAELRSFLAALVGGRTLVLLGSRGSEAWLAQAAHGDNVYELPGLDPEAASTLAERILEQYHATHYRSDADCQKLLALLHGYPLALEVVLANVQRQSPTAILAALQAGDVTLDSQDSQAKTASILRCIEYSHSNLSPEAQALLACLAPFTSVLNTRYLPQYTQALQQQPALAHLPYTRWPEVLKQAENWGLVSPHAEVSGVLTLQPILPYFLRSRGQVPGQAAVREAIDTAFRQYYDGFGGAIAQLLQSKEAPERQAGQVLARLEYENLSTALHLALAAQVSILEIYRALSSYLDTTQDHARGLQLGEAVLPRLEAYPAEQLAGPLGLEFAAVLDNIGSRQLLLRHYHEAEATYHQALALFTAAAAHDASLRRHTAGVYHQLGRVAQEQRQWAQAAQQYQPALAIQIACNDRYSQASTYHQLGRVAQEQRQWAQAEQHYQQALAIYVAFNDRYEQAGTYHQLGRVAEDQRQWAQAAQHYQQALAIQIAFNDRYEQAGTYHQLGRVAQEQRQWGPARDYFLRALASFAAFDDPYSLGITLRSLARLWQASADSSLPAAVATVLGLSHQEADARLRTADAPAE